MTTIQAHWQQGHVVLDEPIDLAEGSRLIVMLADEADLQGMTEDEQADDPDSIARWIAACDAIPPLPTRLAVAPSLPATPTSPPSPD